MLVIALLAAVTVWAVTSAGGDRRKDDAKSGDSGPAPSITPGPSSSGPVVGQPPGGRDESGDSGGGGAGTDPGAGGGDGGTGAGSAAGSGTTGAGGSTAAGAGSAGSVAGGTGTGTPAVQVPAGSALPNCAASALQLGLRTDNSYGPDDKPEFRLTVRNTSATDCKADFGPKSAVLTVTEAGGEDEQVWSSEDCPAAAGPVFLKIPAGATVVHTVTWDRRTSTPKCATPAVAKASPGTYLLEAQVPGEPLRRVSFVLARD